jgi:hypothetical protein
MHLESENLIKIGFITSQTFHIKNGLVVVVFIHFIFLHNIFVVYDLIDFPSSVYTVWKKYSSEYDDGKTVLRFWDENWFEMFKKNYFSKAFGLTCECVYNIFAVAIAKKYNDEANQTMLIG